MRRRLLVVSLFALGAVGCGDNSAPVLSPLVDQTAYVNVEITLALSAADADDDELTFSFTSELPAISKRASLESGGDGQALFHWTPLLSDVGLQAFDFAVSDGESESRMTIAIDVVKSSEGSGAPVFVQPLGTGSTLDLNKTQCLEVPIQIEDPDSPGVTLDQEEPLIAGAQLDQLGELHGSWLFCPSVEQIETDDRYTLTLSADDGDNPKTLKDYLIVLRIDNKQDCEGDPPVVKHTPEDVESVNDLTIVAQVTDDVGIKYEPLLYYSLTPPSDPPDVTSMTQLTMLLIDGDMQAGNWAADVPNPVASSGPGSSAQLHYVIVAQDNDDPEGTCDHLTQAPDGTSFAMTVTNPGGTGGLGLCEPCTADVQCGGAPDLCVFLDGDHHCFQGCDGNSTCPDGYYCSYSAFTSIDNVSARQCIPNDYKCTTTGGGCTDDSYEDNDSLAQATSTSVLPPGDYNLMSCPGETSGDDEDWFRIDVSSDAQVDVSISGQATTDLDLALTDDSGAILDKGDTLSSAESVTACLTPGTYYIHVYAYGTGDNSYSLSYSQTSTSCGSSCQDDENEDDDDSFGARTVDLNNAPYTSDTQAICSGDEDWFEMYMFASETLHASLLFHQANGAEDLDLYIYDSTLTNLTDCSEQTPLFCDSQNGQSGTSDEKLEWDIPTTGTYYVVVHGWAGSENLYDICIGLSDIDCPNPP